MFSSAAKLLGRVAGHATPSTAAARLSARTVVASAQLQRRWMAIHDIQSKEQLVKLFTERKPNDILVVHWTASWCGPCKQVQPTIDKMAQDSKNVEFARIDVDDQAELAGEAQISAVPTFHVFKDNAQVGEVQGAQPTVLQALIEKHSSE
jgi:thioredoxin